MKLETNASDDGWDVWMVIEEAVPDTDGTYFVGTVEEAYAKEIVKRVNLHDELVETLDHMTSITETLMAWFSKEMLQADKNSRNKAIDAAKELIAKARPE